MAPRVLTCALGWALADSRSPRETALALMLTMPTEMGGYDLPKPQLNAHIHAQATEDGVTPDLLWEEARLVVEYDSNEFHATRGPHKIDADIERANALRTAGYTVLEVTPGLVSSLQRLDTLAAQVAQLLGVDFVCDQQDPELRFRRTMLHRELFFD